MMNRTAVVWRALAAVVALSLAWNLSSCTTTIIEPVDPAQPITVFVIDHGRTSSLVIPATDGDMLRYAYGDWNYYALGRDDLLHGIAALLWPTQGALGRGNLAGPPTRANVTRQVNLIEYVHPVRVSHVRVVEFERDMESRYRSHAATQVENMPYGMSFVHHPHHYTYFWNSNHAVASWLRELDCRTRGLAFHASWRVQPPRAAAPSRRRLSEQ